MPIDIGQTTCDNFLILEVIAKLDGEPSTVQPWAIRDDWKAEFLGSHAFNFIYGVDDKSESRIRDRLGNVFTPETIDAVIAELDGKVGNLTILVRTSTVELEESMKAAAAAQAKEVADGQASI